MTATSEFRVRPVTRFNLTHFQSEGASSGVRSLGEFGSIEQAEEVGMALNCLVPGSTFQTLDGRTAGEYPIGLLAAAIERDAPPTQYVIVAVHTFQIETKAYFADNLIDAEKRKTEAELTHGTEFRIFSR
jgi:hypothetical protein